MVNCNGGMTRGDGASPGKTKLRRLQANQVVKKAVSSCADFFCLFDFCVSQSPFTGSKKTRCTFCRFCSYIKQHFHYEILGYGFYRYLLKGHFPGSTMFFLQKRGLHAGNTMEFFSWCNPLNISIMVVHFPWGETW